MKVFKSKFGYGILVFLLVIFGLTSAFMFYTGAPTDAMLVVNGIFILVIGYFIFLNITTFYVITSDNLLHVRYGLFYRKWYDISKIRSIKRTNNLFTAPAPSLDRVELVYGQYGLIVISPKDKEGFAKELIMINPDIVNNLDSAN